MSTAPSCRWPVDWTCLPEITDDNRPIIHEAVDTAVGVLWSLTGRRYGACPVEVRPCPPGTPSEGLPLLPSLGWQPVIDSGAIRNTPTCMPVDCDRTGAVLLPGPVARILGFTVDGDDVSLDSLVIDGDRVYRWDRRAWPEQNLARRADEKGTWSIRYLRGQQPPAGAAHCVGVLAREFYQACTGGQCQLPRRTTQVARQGVTVTMVDPQAIYDSGATGITEVDLWIRAHNPHKLAQPAAVWSPDLGVW